MKQATMGLAIIVCFLLAGTHAWGEDRVVTIYFCGTGLTSAAYQASGSPWHRPELVAELYSNDNSEPIKKIDYIPGNIVYKIETLLGQNHYKYIADGLGTDVFSWFGIIDPDFGVRGWDAVEDEAFNAVKLISDNHPGDNIILNLVGFSRGGILCMKTARRVADYGPVVKINILAFDPVPGGLDPVGRFGTDLILPTKVNQYIGIYARDELTTIFEPVIPDLSELNSSAKYWLVNIPGSHETMVGNDQLDGHAKMPTDLLDWSHESGQHPVNQVARLIAQQLLTSVEWGETQFSEMAPENNEEDFCVLVKKMYDYNYSFVRLNTFLLGYTGYDFCYSTTGRDHHLRFTSAIPSNRLCFVAPERHSPEWVWTKCAFWPVWFPSAAKVYWLSTKTSALDSRTAWKQLAYLRGISEIEDTTPPVPIVDSLPDIVGECSVNVASAPTANDDVSGTIKGTTSDPLTYTEPGTYTITWAYEDARGNTAKQTQIVVVADTTPPAPDSDDPETDDILEGLPDIYGECSAEITTNPTATDNCFGPVVGTTDKPWAYNEQGEYEIDWTYTDDSQNELTQLQKVIVKDITPPQITSCPSDITVEPAGPLGTPVTFSVTSSDNCTSAVSCTVNSGVTFGVGTTPVTCTATDQGGNSDTCTFNVTVLSEEEVVQGLLDKVAALETDGVSQEICDGLSERLLSILEKYEKGGPVTGCCNKIESFISKVQTEIEQLRLTPEQGQPLIDSANNLLTTGDCPL